MFPRPSPEVPAKGSKTKVQPNQHTVSHEEILLPNEQTKHSHTELDRSNQAFKEI
jgi:hypothetical protein